MIWPSTERDDPVSNGHGKIALVNMTVAHLPYCEPLGVCYLASVLRNRGFKVDLYDINAQGRRSYRSLADALIDGHYGFIGLSAVEANMPDVVWMCKELGFRSKATRIIAGGYGPSFWAKELVEQCPEVIVLRGEAEDALPMTIERLCGDADIHGIQGLVFMDSGRVYDGGWCKQTKDLDKLPWPARDLSDYALSIQEPLAILSKRGCYGNCTFCSVKVFARGELGQSMSLVRSRSARDVVMEMRSLWDRGVSHLQFSDTNFFDRDDSQGIRSFVNELGAATNRPKFSIKCRVEDVLNCSVHLRDMKELGLEHVFIGIESGSDEELRTLNKGVTREDCRLALETLDALSIGVSVGLILFGPYTSRNDIRDTLDLIRPYCYDVDIISRLMVFRDTPIMKRLDRDGRLQQSGFRFDYELAPEIEYLWSRWSHARNVMYKMIVRAGLLNRFRHDSSFRKQLLTGLVDSLLGDLPVKEAEDLRPFQSLIRHLEISLEEITSRHG